MYTVRINFDKKLISSYRFCLHTINLAAFKWIGGRNNSIPKMYDDIFEDNDICDIQSFSSYYSFSMALSQLIDSNNSPLLIKIVWNLRCMCHL